MGQIKIMQNGEWLDPEEACARRRAGQVKPVEELPREYVPLDVDKLPSLMDLDPNCPWGHLFHEYPEIRPFINSKGEIRSGLKDPYDLAIAKQIRRRYGFND